MGRASAEPAEVDHEEPRWLDPDTGKASRAQLACGVRLDFDLDEDGSRDLLKVTIANRSEEAATLHADRAIVRLPSGPEYRLLPLREKAITVEGASEGRTVLAFPEHAGVRTARRMTIALPIETSDHPDCVATTDFERPMTFWPSSVKLSFGVGSRFVALGGPHRLGGKNGVETVQGSMALFWNAHGVTFDVFADYYGGAQIPSLGTGVELGANPRLNAQGYFFGYAVRAPVFSWLSVHYGASAGIYAVSLHDDSQKKARLTNAYGAFRQQAGLTAAILPSRFTQVALSPTVVHTFLPGGSFGEVSARGSAVSWMMNVALLF